MSTVIPCRKRNDIVAWNGSGAVGRWWFDA